MKVGTKWKQIKIQEVQGSTITGDDTDGKRGRAGVTDFSKSTLYIRNECPLSDDIQETKTVTEPALKPGDGANPPRTSNERTTSSHFEKLNESGHTKRLCHQLRVNGHRPPTILQWSLLKQLKVWKARSTIRQAILQRKLQRQPWINRSQISTVYCHEIPPEWLVSRS